MEYTAELDGDCSHLGQSVLWRGKLKTSGGCLAENLDAAEELACSAYEYMRLTHLHGHMLRCFGQTGARRMRAYVCARILDDELQVFDVNLDVQLDLMAGPSHHLYLALVRCAGYIMHFALRVRHLDLDKHKLNLHIAVDDSTSNSWRFLDLAEVPGKRMHFTPWAFLTSGKRIGTFVPACSSLAALCLHQLSLEQQEELKQHLVMPADKSPVAFVV
jgi:hypothetical protein